VGKVFQKGKSSHPYASWGAIHARYCHIAAAYKKCLSLDSLFFSLEFKNSSLSQAAISIHLFSGYWWNSLFIVFALAGLEGRRKLEKGGGGRKKRKGCIFLLVRPRGNGWGGRATLYLTWVRQYFSSLVPSFYWWSWSPFSPVPGPFWKQASVVPSKKRTLGDVNTRDIGSNIYAVSCRPSPPRHQDLTC